MEIAGQWVEIWSWDVDSDTHASNSNKPAWLTITRDATANTSAKVKFSIQTNDETQFDTDLVTA